MTAAHWWMAATAVFLCGWWWWYWRGAWRSESLKRDRQYPLYVMVFWTAVALCVIVGKLLGGAL